MMPTKYVREMFAALILGVVLQLLADHSGFPEANSFLLVLFVAYLIWFFVRAFRDMKNHKIFKMLEELREKEKRRELLRKLVRR
jgi:threonine/homoserine/homoserine lactone efflux protein